MPGLLWVVLIALIVFSLGGLPNWGWHNYGYYPSGLGFVIVIILLVVLLGR